MKFHIHGILMSLFNRLLSSSSIYTVSYATDCSALFSFLCTQILYAWCLCQTRILFFTLHYNLLTIRWDGNFIWLLHHTSCIYPSSFMTMMLLLLLLLFSNKRRPSSSIMALGLWFHEYKIFSLLDFYFHQGSYKLLRLWPLTGETWMDWKLVRLFHN